VFRLFRPVSPVSPCSALFRVFPLFRISAKRYSSIFALCPQCIHYEFFEKAGHKESVQLLDPKYPFLGQEWQDNNCASKITSIASVHKHLSDWTKWLGDLKGEEAEGRPNFTGLLLLFKPIPLMVLWQSLLRLLPVLQNTWPPTTVNLRLATVRQTKGGCNILNY
jgi:hypothetical protein